jgi:hypothetical protein
MNSPADTPLQKKGYLRRLKKNVERKPPAGGHPRNSGVKMQAHHLISAKSVRLARLSNRLRDLGYDINTTSNLVFLPCTLQGACHLGVQLHRGDHSHVDADAFDDDELHKKPYHVRVKKKLVRRFKKQEKKGLCSKNRHMIRKRVQKVMNRLSQKILHDIQSYDLKLTSIATNFDVEGGGCRGVDTVPLARKAKDPCEVGRNHSSPQGTHQGHQNNNFRKPRGRYKLRAGR